jgi:hypothetical protein
VKTSSDRPSISRKSTDLDLLRRFEPVVKYTKGEQFFPFDVERYVSECSLWAHNPDGREELLVRQEEMTIEQLVAERPATFGTIHFLRFIETLSLSESAQALTEQSRLRRKLHNQFNVGMGRLARGGFLPRIADALFSLSLLMRGKVSPATAAAAEIAYERMHEKEEKYTYYGRVVRQNGWIILQYWFFFCYNSWRSGFHGVNDHESDWEMITLYLYEDGDELFPEWAAYASHDFHGDDLRRRWDDEGQLDLVSGHPVVYAGAGSHASYFRPGEYQAEVTLPLPDWFSGITKVFNKFWTETLGQPEGNPFRIPFVDFARGDGHSIGHGQEHAWSAVVIDDSVPWVSQYRGLWGLFARDPVSGENAPAGPMYNRDGSPRSSWYDPLGFAGLDKTPPPPQALKLLQESSSEIEKRQNELNALIPQKATELQVMGMKLKGLEDHPHLAKIYALLQKRIGAVAEELKNLRRERMENGALLQGLTQRLEQLEAGIEDNPHAHIQHMAVPVEAVEVRYARAAETWAAISLSLLVFAIAGLIFFAPTYIWAGMSVILILFVVAESIMRGAFIQTVSRVTLILALLTSVILLIEFWKFILVALLIILGIFLMAQRLRELAH